MSTDNEYMLKICVLGSVSELKTEFIHFFAEGKFNLHYVKEVIMPTLGVDISIKIINVDDNEVKLILVDTAGQEFFGKLRPSYYRGASVATILFDKCDRQSFETLPNWLREFQKYIGPDVSITLVGLITQCEENSQEIPSEKGSKLAALFNMTYFGSSPTDRQKSYEIFSHLARQVIEK